MSANENSSNDNGNGVTEVQVTGFNMPFADLVGFMAKAAIASIPATIIVTLTVAMTVATLIVWFPIVKAALIAVTP